MSDIVKRLREGRTDGSHLRWTVTDIHQEAADEIERLRSLLAEPRTEPPSPVPHVMGPTDYEGKLSDFLDALDEWGCDDNTARAQQILDFQRSGYDLDAYLEDHPDREKSIETVNVNENYVIFAGGLKLPIETYLLGEEEIENGRQADSCFVNHPYYGRLQIDIEPIAPSIN